MKNRLFRNPRLLALFLITASIDHAMALEKNFADHKVTLTGHVPKKALANAAHLDEVDSEADVSLTFVLPLRNQETLEKLVEQMYDPNNKEYYRKYLTPEEFADRFSPTEEDYNKVVDYAKEAGFNVVELHANRTLVQVSGNAKSIQQAFDVTLNIYQEENGLAFYAPSNDPNVQKEIASKIGGIVGLDNIASQKPLAQYATLQPNAFPSGPAGGLSPSDIKKAYNLTAVSEDGTGQKIAIFAPASYRLSDITTYANFFHLPTPKLTNVLVDGGPTFEAMEVALDIELAFAIAPASEIYVYQGPNTAGSILNIYNRIATDNIAKQVSTSWGWPENYAGLSILKAENAIFLQMAAQGQTVYAASGDKGAYENGPSAHDLEVQDPGSQPYVTCVGGTSLTVDPASGNYVSETVWKMAEYSMGGGGGVSEVWPLPVWQQNLPTASSTTYRNTPDVSLNADLYQGYDICYQGNWYMMGGTSCAAPVWAGFNALVNQRRQATLLPPLGFANPMLYNLGKLPATKSTVFHDIITGDNLFYLATTSYDNATGWGSFNGQSLLDALSDTITLSISSPANNGNVAGNINISASATNPIGIGKVDFYINSTLIGSDTTAPYNATYSTVGLADGLYVLKAVAYSTLGNSAQSTRTINIYNGKPKISLVSPISGATLAGNVNFGASASDAVPIDHVDFYVDATLLSSDTTAPYQTSFDTKTLLDGTHLLKAVAYNNLGTFSEGTAAMNVYNGKPTVNVLSPILGATVEKSVNFTVAATDAVPVKYVNLYIDETLLGVDTTPPYQISIDTMPMSDGPHLLRAVAYNNLGAVSEATGTINVYNNKPTINFLSPTSGATVAKNVNFAANATDAAPIQRVEFYVDGILLATDTTTPYQTSVDTTTFSDGTHALKAVAYNNLGLFSERTGTMNVYNGKPALTLQSPISGATVAKNINFSANATDLVPMDHVDFYIDATLVASDTVPPYQISFDTTTISNGPHLLKAVAYNNLNTFSEGTAAINVYNGNPKVTVQSPIRGATVAKSINFAATATDAVPIDHVDFYADTTLVATDATAPYQISLNTNILSNGPHLLRAVAYNNLGSSSEGTAAINVYNGKPVMSIQSPLPGATVAKSVNFTVTATDIVPMNRVEFYLDGVVFGADATVPYQIPINTTTLSDGTHALRAVGYNSLGSLSDIRSTMNVYNGKPVVSIQPIALGKTVSKSITFAANATDAVPIDHVDFYVDATLLGSDTTAPYETPLDTTTLSDGTHVLRAVAYNNLGSSSEGTAAINVYNSWPTVRFQSPISGGTVAKDVIVAANVIDTVPIDHVDLYVDATLLGSDTTAPYQTSVDTTTLSNGTHLLRAVAYNNVGAYSEGTAAMNVYNGKPTVNLPSPTPGATVARSVTFAANATDAVPIDHVDFYVDAILVGSDTTAPYETPLDTTTLADGPHVLRAVAYNNLGSFSQGTATMNVYNSRPAVTVQSPTPGGTVAKSVTFAANAIDAVPIDHVDLYVDAILLGSDTTAPYEIPLDTTTLADGTHVLRAVAYNNLGSFSEGTAAMNVYNSRPAVNIQSPLPGGTVAKSVTFAANAIDSVPIDHVDFYVDTMFLGSDITAPYEAPLDTTTLADGTHVLRAVAYNNLSSFSEGTAAMNVYNGKPKVNVQSPLRGATVAKSINFAATATDIAPIDRVDFYVDSTLVASDTVAPYQTSVNTTTFSNGPHLLKAVAYNNLGSSSEGTAGINVYNGKPVLSVVSPSPGATVAKSVNYLVNVTDLVPIQHVDFYLDGGLIGTDTVAPYQISVNTATLSNGPHGLRAVGYNTLGSLSDVRSTMNVYNGKPNLNLISPIQGATLSGIVNVSANATDAVNMSKVDFYVDTTLLATDTAAPYTTSLNTNGLSTGKHTIKAVAYNELGSSSEATAQVNVFNTAPAVTFNSPLNATTVTGSINVSVTVSNVVTTTAEIINPDGTKTKQSVAANTSLKKFDIYLDSNLIAKTTESFYTTTINANLLSKGVHTLRAVAENYGGLSGESAITITVQ